MKLQLPVDSSLQQIAAHLCVIMGIPLSHRACVQAAKASHDPFPDPTSMDSEQLLPRRRQYRAQADHLATSYLLVSTQTTCIHTYRCSIKLIVATVRQTITVLHLMSASTCSRYARHCCLLRAHHLQVDAHQTLEILHQSVQNLSAVGKKSRRRTYHDDIDITDIKTRISKGYYG